MDESPEPDPFEKRLRFGCGFLFGGLIAFIIALREFVAYTGLFWATIAAVAIISGILAVRYGDEFWRRVSDLFHW